MDLNLIISFTSIIAGLISILLGIWVAGRLTGKFKTGIIFLIGAMIVFTIKEITKTCCLFVITSSVIGSTICDFPENIVNVVIISFILLAIFSMRQMISGIDSHHKKSKKR